MGLFKEEIREIEMAEKRQAQIWPDSCDEGVEATPALKQAVKELLKLHRSTCSWKSNAGGCLQRKYSIIVQFDFQSYWIREILYFKGKGKEFFSIERNQKPILEKDKNYEVEYGLR